MAPTKKNDYTLVASIIFAAVAISASLIFFAFQFSGGNLKDDVLAEKIGEGIEAYVQKTQQEYDEKAQAAQPPAQVNVADFIDDDAVLGNADAPIAIVEFSDYECPFCGQFFRETYPQLKSEYIDKGLVKMIYRDNPLGFHPNAYPAALAAECVRDQLGDAGYFKMHDKIFTEGDLSLSSLESYAISVGANAATYEKCVESEKFKDEILADSNDAMSANLTGTPSFIVNGTVITGAQPFAAFKQVIDAELNK